MFSWMYRGEGRDLLPTRSGLGGFLWSLRQPLPCRARPISPGLRPGRGQAKPQRNPPVSPSAPVLPVDISLGLGGRSDSGAQPQDPAALLPPSCQDRQSFPGAAARARQERAAAGKCLLCLEILTRGTALGPLPATC